MFKFIQKMYKSLFRIREFEEKIESLHEENYKILLKLADAESLARKKDSEISQMKKLHDELLSDPKVVLQEILKGNLEWYDYKELTPSDLNTYQVYAEAVRSNPAFTNEINHLIQILSLRALSEPKTLEELRDLQITAVAMESIKMHFADIPKPIKKQDKALDPHSTL